MEGKIRSPSHQKLNMTTVLRIRSFDTAPDGCWPARPAVLGRHLSALAQIQESDVEGHAVLELKRENN